MNWTGGSRNRVRRNKDLQKQREFFQQQKFEQQQQQRKQGLSIFHMACAALNYPMPRSDSSLAKTRHSPTDNSSLNPTMGPNWDLINLQFASYMSKPIPTDSNNASKAKPFDLKRMLNLRDLKPSKKVRSTNMPSVEQNMPTATDKRDWTLFLKYASKTEAKEDGGGSEHKKNEVGTECKEDNAEAAASYATKRVAFSDALQFRNYTPPSSSHSEESPNAARGGDVNTPVLSGNSRVSRLLEAKIASPAMSPIVGELFRSSPIAVFCSTPTSESFQPTATV